MQHFFYSLGLFGVMEFLGDVWPGLIDNMHCFRFIGCNTGFAGYDGLVHFMSGICIGLGLIWLKRRGARHMAAWGLGIALAWEAMEWAYDWGRAAILGMDLLAPYNIMTQPSGIDTLGDVILGCLGTALAYGAYRLSAKRP
jgi:hypothetical protein